MREVADGVFMVAVPTPFPVGPVNCYVLDGHPLTLIDCGPRYPPAINELGAALDELGHDFSEVQQILLTHGHIDHAGLAGFIAASGRDAGQENARVYVHSEDLRRVADHQRYIRGRMQAYIDIALRSGAPEAMITAMRQDSLAEYFAALGESVPHAVALADGDRVPSPIGRFDIVWTPGHTRGCVCYAANDQHVLFTGDHVLLDISSNPSLDFEGSGISLLTYLDSLTRILRYDGHLVLPGHREPIQDLAKRVEELRADIEDKLDRLHDALGPTPTTIYDLSRILYGDYGLNQLVLALAETTDLARVLEERGEARLVETEEHPGVVCVRSSTNG
ncbi:MAG: MBL fold metallo-hydrolase [Candidatus Thorarchaeota archaeon]